MTNPFLDLRSEAHLWWVDATAPEVRRRADAYQRLLAPEETSRWQGIRVARGRDEYLVGRALLRTTLSRYFPRPPEAWRFVLAERGRPELADPGEEPTLAELRFNLAHADGLVACLVASSREAGVDVEHPAREVDVEALAARFFSDAERHACAMGSTAERRRAFFTVWTLKEAYLKARGVGIGLPLRALSFTLAAPAAEADAEAARIEAAFGPQLEDRPALWQFDLFRAPSGHLLATALGRGGEAPLTVVARPTLPLGESTGGATLQPLASSV